MVYSNVSEGPAVVWNKDFMTLNLNLHGFFHAPFLKVFWILKRNFSLTGSFLEMNALTLFQRLGILGKSCVLPKIKVK